jgi:type II secretory pathway component PulM
MAVFDPVRERFSGVVAGMSARDRRLLMGLVVFVACMLLGFTWWLGRSILGDVQSRVEDREDTLALLQGLAADNAGATEQITQIEEQLRKGAGQDLPSYVEKAAEKVGISSNLQGVREKQVVTDGNLEEKTYTLEVAKVTLDQLTSFLYELETGGFPLKSRSAKIKSSTVAGAKVLSLSMELSAYKLIEEAPSEPAPSEETPG